MDSFDGGRNEACRYQCGRASIRPMEQLLPDPQETLDITLYPDGKREIRLSAYDHFSPPRYDALPVAFCKRDGRKERATLSFECKPDECFAGTGERFFKMDLSGQTFFLKNQDGQGVNNRRTYKNIPFYLSSRMYGTFYHTCAHSKLSLAGHSTRSVQFLATVTLLDVFVIGGDTMEDILRGYRDLTGYRLCLLFGVLALDEPYDLFQCR